VSNEILELDEVERIAKEYVQRRENASNVEVKGTEWSSIGGLLLCLVLGKARRNSIDLMTSQAGELEECPFSLQVLAKDRNVVGYKPGSWRKIEGQQIPQSETSYDSLDEELKQSEIERNRVEAEYYEEKMERDMQERDKSSDLLAKKYGIDINKFKI
jgi:hypothetical protein